ncbi:unnamed protein product [Triticum turgidum subsp. durum]|uniref:Uncharacterized protein n=1 Tax=Triticum turgidum subsp. durum TaxID=4567 RepID=A0A9R0WL74_TRITD|nr:unnamed protein product [Triticum turgidum subsp. durum]
MNDTPCSSDNDHMEEIKNISNILRCSSSSLLSPPNNDDQLIRPLLEHWSLLEKATHLRSGESEREREGERSRERGKGELGERSCTHW